MSRIQKRTAFSIAFICLFVVTVGVSTARQQTLLAHVATVLVCAIAQPFHATLSAEPLTKCATNNGGIITIIRNRSAESIEDIVIPLP